MKTGKYTLREFFSDRDLNSIIVPEIQRDYVWGKEQIMKFLESIIDDFDTFMNSEPIEIKSVNSEIVDSYNEFYKKNYLSSNIGFIYAYSDSDYPGSIFLIDGQQRFTTIYLTLLVLAANGDDQNLNNFKRIFLNEGKPKLDYRVREASHIFLHKLIQTIDQTRCLLSRLSSNWIKEQSWYLQDYENDATISSVISNIDDVTEFLKNKQIIKPEEGCVNKDFVEYVEDYLEFWYFDTNISEQGEELYIYMNARGESMQEHENLKADLIGKLKDTEMKKKYGKKWEEWQDLFWRNKGKNTNADKGFNEFLCCVAGLENYLKKKYQKPEDKDFVRDGEIVPYDNKKDLLSMELLEQYYNGFAQLICANKIKNFSEKYNYSDWINKAIKVIWDIFNENRTNWFADYHDDNRSTERNRMVYVWSMLYYMKSLNDKDESLENIYRTFRLFYIRYKNYIRAVDRSIENIDNILIKNSPWYQEILLEGEEQNKYVFLKDKSKLFEEWIWRIEDHPLNLDGRDVGGKNCSHLVDFDRTITCEDLQNIYDKFCKIFPIDGDRYKIASHEELLNALLYNSIFNCDAKPFWDKENKGYYEKLDFSKEKRYIRGLSTYGDNNVFKTFFDEFDGENYINKTKGDVENEMEIKNVKKEKVEDSNVIWGLAWFATQLEEMWKEGKYIALNRSYYFENSIKSEPFPLIFIENFKGDFRGGDPKLLSNLIKEVLKK